MGFKYYKGNVQCPLFINAIHGNKGQLIGIECQPTPTDLGFETTQIIRLKCSQDLKDYTEIFCKDLYDTCPYYRMIMSKIKEMVK